MIMIMIMVAIYNLQASGSKERLFCANKNLPMKVAKTRNELSLLNTYTKNWFVDFLDLDQLLPHITSHGEFYSDIF